MDLGIRLKFLSYFLYTLATSNRTDVCILQVVQHYVVICPVLRAFDKQIHFLY